MFLRFISVSVLVLIAGSSLVFASSASKRPDLGTKFQDTRITADSTKLIEGCVAPRLTAPHPEPTQLAQQEPEPTKLAEHEPSAPTIELSYPTQKKTRSYVIVKVLMFLFYGSLGSLMPYLPVYYHSLGISDKKIGQLGAITPATTFFVAPLWGALADRTGQLKLVLLSTFSLSVALRLGLLLNRTFAWIAVVNFLTAVVNAPVRPLLDSSVLSLLEHKKDYGKQRLFGQCGFGVFSGIVGPFLTHNKGHGRVGGGYQAAFLTHLLVSIPTFLVMCKFNPTPTEDGKSPIKKEPPKFREGLKVVAQKSDNIVFFCLVFAIGLSSGVIENFAYKRLRELGGGGQVMGVSRLVSSVCGIPMFYFSGDMTKHFSVMGVLMCSLLTYITRFFIYGLAPSPWYGLPAEALRGVSLAGMWSASTYYTHKIAPEGMSATLLGFLNGVYGGIGQSMGSLIGGGLSSSFGTAAAFFIYGSIDILIIILFGVYWYFHPRATCLD